METPFAIPPVPPLRLVHPPKVARTEPCTCQSGRKYKKCCMESTEGVLAYTWAA